MIEGFFYGKMTEQKKCETLKEKGFSYNPETGLLTGIKGHVIKRRNNEGYIYCKVRYEKKQESVLGHRLAWYLYYGKLPFNYIDHIDGVKDNNKIDNLRDVTKAQNSLNRTKAKGVHWHKRVKKYCAQIQIKAKKTHIGYFDDEIDARKAYLEAKKKYHVIPNHHETINHDI